MHFLKNLALVCLFVFLNSSIFSNSILKFNLNIGQCEDHYVACAPLSDGSYQYGFVYTGKSGLTFKLEGSFKIDNQGKYLKIPYEKTNQTVSLSNSESNVALIPQEKFKELNLDIFPSWYSSEVKITESAGQLYAKGYTENLKKDYQKAIVYFHKAFLIDSDFKNLKIQYAKALNACKNYNKAHEILVTAAKAYKNSAEFNQEYAISLLYTGNAKLADKHAKKFLTQCELNSQKHQLCIVFSSFYLAQKNKKEFNKWINMSKTYINDDPKAEKETEQLIKKASNW